MLSCEILTPSGKSDLARHRLCFGQLCQFDFLCVPGGLQLVGNYPANPVIEQQGNLSAALPLPISSQGPIEDVAHEGGRPVAITWCLRRALRQAMPTEVHSGARDLRWREDNSGSLVPILSAPPIKSPG